MRRVFLIWLVLLMFLVYPKKVLANIICNDGTVSPSCSDCHRGCCSKHGGCSSSSSSSSSSNKKPTTSEKVKSSDNTLKLLLVDDEDILVSNIMTYSTNKEKVKIEAIANDSKATLSYPKNVDLTIGENFINITITAENGNVRKYILNITREKILNNNKNIKIYVDAKELSFNDFKSEIVMIDSELDSLNITYELEDTNARVEIMGNANLEVGYNEVIVRVTAEDKTDQDYLILVEKEDKKEEQPEEIIEDKTESNYKPPETVTFVAKEKDSYNIFSIYLSVILYGGVSYLIYKILKKKR